MAPVEKTETSNSSNYSKFLPRQTGGVSDQLSTTTSTTLAPGTNGTFSGVFGGANITGANKSTGSWYDTLQNPLKMNGSNATEQDPIKAYTCELEKIYIS